MGDLPFRVEANGAAGMVECGFLCHCGLVSCLVAEVVDIKDVPPVAAGGASGFPAQAVSNRRQMAAASPAGAAS
ncbi:hypothetical protein STA1M1_13370 [Sinisalibacter aestuarii]|uniref:Uncharacterized protein n=1 Tax=Sinisalibacter aestuarii TaxID=2949426 RepID=A0ABQ5LS71_9RHOB|nr:hypothetical protein STA1M1_13370 [Sinisalibacter aestuarii]